MTRELPRFAFHRTTIFLVHTVLAILFPVALPCFRYARAIRLAQNFVGLARTRLYIFRTISLVGTVSAVVLAVAPPSVRYATAVIALELGLRTIRIFTIHFVLPILAISIEIAQPILRNALVIVALEIGRATGRLVAL